MRNLDLTEMECIEGGSCAWAIAGTVIAYAGLFALGPVTGGASWLALGAATSGFVVSAVGMGYSCRR